MQRTATSPAVTLPPAAPRSGWLLRALFAVVVAGVLAAGTLVAALVGFTFLRLTDEEATSSALKAQPSFRISAGLPGVAAAEAVNVWDRHGPLNVLLIGLDAVDCAVQNSTTTARRADTILLLRIDPSSGRAALMNLPRDLYVAVPGHDSRKINTAHVFGELDPDLPGGGPELLKRTIELNLGLAVHRYVRVDFEGFQRIIEALEGVEIDVPEDGLYDDEFPDKGCGTVTIEFEPGRQHMDGERALQYARSRHSTSDFDRSKRQMQLLLALRERAMDLGALAKLPRLVPALLDTVDTNLSVAEILSLAGVAGGMDTEDITTLPVDENAVTDARIHIDGANQAVLFLKPEALEDLGRRFVTFAPPPADAAVGGGDVPDALPPEPAPDAKR